MSRVHIKCCGMFRPQDIQAVNAARPDYCGFVVNFPRSHRSVSPSELRALRSDLQSGIEAVGVFVDEDPVLIAALVKDGIIDAVQLHGHEDEAYIACLRNICTAPIIQAFKVHMPKDVQRACQSSAEMILLDSGTGSGKCFDWSLVRQAPRPFILAGGLNPDNLAQAISETKPWGVDLSSGLEIQHVKDADLIARAVAAVVKG